MACTITFSNLANGQVIELPFGVEGTITTPGGAQTGIIAVSKQIDDNPLQDIGPSCLPPPVVGNLSLTFLFELTATDCPAPDTFYMVSIYAWDNQDTQVSLASVTFKTAAAPAPPPAGPPGKLPPLIP